MEVTNENFKQLLPLVEESIDDAVFLSIDGEFTGINMGEGGPSALDTSSERYAKVSRSTSKFLLVQFGLCTFHYDPKKGLYTNRGFNFYVWPRPSGRMYPDPRFLCQTSSVDFLINQGFDFNKLFKDGIPYLRLSEEQKLKESLIERQAQRKAEDSVLTPSPASRDPIPIPDDQRDFMDETFNMISNYLNDPNQTGSLDLPRCNPFQRRLLYSNVKAKFGPDHGIFMETVSTPTNARVIRISKVNEDEQKRRALERDQAELNDLSDAVGFSKVVRKICESKKLVVGHNMLLDLCHMVNQFVAPLPETLAEFKDLMAEHLPHVCDTKLMANTSPFKEEIARSSLESLIKVTSEKPYKMPEVSSSIDDGYVLTTEKYHEAGYDAFITGLCFISMSNRLGSIKGESKKLVLPDSPLVAPFKNKVCLQIPDIPYLNLSGEDLDPNRDHVFHVQFPSQWKTSDLQQLFSSFAPVQIAWLNDRSAYVSLKEHPENARMVMPSLNCSSVYCIMPYHQHKRMEAGLRTELTPTLESIKVSFPKSAAKDPHNNGKSALKRSAPDIGNPKKRNKSATETEDQEKKVFEEPPWE